MSTYFEHNLENIKSKLLLMGQLASESLRMAMEALVEADPVLAKKVKEKDEEIDELENENNRLSSLLRQVTSKSAEAVHQYRGLHDILVEKVKHEKDLKSELAELQHCRDEFENIVQQEHKTSTENEKLSNSLRTAELDILSARASEAVQGTKIRELSKKLKEEQRKVATMKKEIKTLRLSAPEDIQRLVNERDRLEKEIDDTREVLGVLKSGSLHSAIKRINRVSMLKQNRMKKTIESLQTENRRLMKIEFHVKKLERERKVLIEYANRLEGKLGVDVINE